MEHLSLCLLELWPFAAYQTCSATLLGYPISCMELQFETLISSTGKGTAVEGGADGAVHGAATNQTGCASKGRSNDVVDIALAGIAHARPEVRQMSATLAYNFTLACTQGRPSLRSLGYTCRRRGRR